MSNLDWLVVVLFASLAPFGVLRGFVTLTEARPARAPLLAVYVTAAGFVLVAIAAFAADPILEWLNISAENFQLAVGIAMLPVALRLLWSGRSMSVPPDRKEPDLLLLAPLLMGPVPFVTALYFGARYGTDTTLAAGAIALAVSGTLLLAARLLLDRFGEQGLYWLGCCSGAVLIVIAVKLGIDGVYSV